MLTRDGADRGPGTPTPHASVPHGTRGAAGGWNPQDSMGRSPVMGTSPSRPASPWPPARSPGQPHVASSPRGQARSHPAAAAVGDVGPALATHSCPQALDTLVLHPAQDPGACLGPAVLVRPGLVPGSGREEPVLSLPRAEGTQAQRRGERPVTPERRRPALPDSRGHPGCEGGRT